jgi:uroporphyrinogen III methyltransferase/synthase
MKVDLVPDYFISEGIIKSFAGIDLRKKKILIPRAYSARDVLPAGLKKLGAKVDVVTAYETANSGKKKEEIEKLFDENRVDVITFTSSSTVNNFVEIMGNDFSYPPKIKIACIGPVTATAAKKAGFSVNIHQEEYTIEGLVRALIDYFEKEIVRDRSEGQKK